MGLMWQTTAGPPTARRGASPLHQLRGALPNILERVAQRAVSEDASARRVTRRKNHFREFFKHLRPGSAVSTGLRPTVFRCGPEEGNQGETRPCYSQAERLEAADQMFAWMHDEQRPYPRPPFLQDYQDALPAPQPSQPRWRIDWDAWADCSENNWTRLSLWDRRLAYSFLPPPHPPA